jgi:AcrR family transcriptional regulator
VSAPTAAGRSRSSTRDSILSILPEGVAPPADVPPEIFAAALQTFLQMRRLDMQALAGELGMGRSSLYRRARSRDHLLSAVLSYLTRRAIVRALDAAQGLTGAGRIMAVVSHFLRDVHGQASLRRLLQEEPEVALRILTSKRGVVQRCLIDAVERLLAEEEAESRFGLTMHRATLAYVIVRIGESFLYADVIADNQPDVDRAAEVIARLVGVDASPSPGTDANLFQRRHR